MSADRNTQIVADHPRTSAYPSAGIGVMLGYDLKTREAVALEADRARVLLVCGKRGSGKSYTLGVLAEELFQQEPKPCVLIVDPVGIFWTLAQAAFGSAASSKPQAERQATGYKLQAPGQNLEPVLQPEAGGLQPGMRPVAWSLQHAQGLPVTLLVPGEPTRVYSDVLREHFTRCGIAMERLTLDPAELSSDAWCELFALSITEPLGIALARAIQSLAGSVAHPAVRDTPSVSSPSAADTLLPGRISPARSPERILPAQSATSFDLAAIEDALQRDPLSQDRTKEALLNRLSIAKSWGLFEATASDVTTTVTPERIGVVDLSILDYGPQGLRSLVLAVLARRLFTHHQRLRQQAVVTDTASLPKLWLLIDEAHQFIPQGSATLAKDAMIRWVKEGRQPGLSCVLASQQPGSLDQDVLSQCDALISHKLTNLDDLQALNRLSQAYMGSELKVYLRHLKQPGQAVLVDDARERVKLLQVRARLTRHGGGEL